MVSLPPIPMKTQCAAVITNRMSIKHTLVRVNRSGHAIPCTTVAVYLVLPVGETCPGRFKMPRVDTKYSVGAELYARLQDVNIVLYRVIAHLPTKKAPSCCFLQVGVGDISFHHQETSDDIDEIQDPRYHMRRRTCL